MLSSESADERKRARTMNPSTSAEMSSRAIPHALGAADLRDQAKKLHEQYSSLMYQRSLVERNLSALKEMQCAFDTHQNHVSFVLKDIIFCNNNLSSKCECTQSGEISDKCMVCNIPTSVMTSIPSPDDLVQTGNVYLVISYKYETVQLCNKNGERINLFWCHLAAIVWLCSHLLTDDDKFDDLFPNDIFVRIPLGGSLFLKYYWQEGTTVLTNGQNSMFWDDSCDFESFYHVCASFPEELVEDVGRVHKSFVPCLFFAMGGCVDCQSM